MASSDEGTANMSAEVTTVSDGTRRKRRKLEDGNYNAWSMGSTNKWSKNGRTTDMPANNEPTLRAGKWTIEEEVYAEYLTSLFMQGVLPDCDIHMTLRAYLAEKLRCKPMRITKKYSTASYDGKMMYTPSGRILSNPGHLAMLQEKYMQSLTRPKPKRSHKKKKSPVSAGEKQASDVSTVTSGNSRDGQESDPSSGSLGKLSSMGSLEYCQSDDSSGQLTPDGIQMVRDALLACGKFELKSGLV